MHFIALLLVLLLLIFAPQWWVRRTLARHAGERKDFPGTGGEFARHLLNKLGLNHVEVEASEGGNHYDPVAKKIRLAPEYKDGRSLTSVVVAAHEVGHAVQDGLDYPLLRWRQRLIRIAAGLERFGAAIMLLLPVVAVITRSPAAGAVTMAAGMVIMLSATLVHLVTLPVEWDASFGRAMPLIKAGAYLSEEDDLAAQQILRACALTYLSASLAGLLNFWRWWQLLRR